jgi:cytochrome c oxidase assembly protein subunit 11
VTASNDKHESEPRMGGRHNVVAVLCAGIVLAMAGLSFAAVPLYRLYCQVTGYQGTTQRADKSSGVVLDRMVTVHFDANVSAGLPWTFEPVQRKLDVKIGENALAFYRATNNSDHAVTGSAVFIVSQDSVWLHFNLGQCLWFTEQRLEAGQSVDMAVSFFVDPGFATDEDTKGLSELTLSYAFYPVAEPTKKDGQAAARITESGG